MEHSRLQLKSLDLCCEKEEEEEEERQELIGTPAGIGLAAKIPTPPEYTFEVGRLVKGSLWDSHCHLDILSSRLQRVGVRKGETLEVALTRDGEDLGDAFGGCIANFCEPQSWSAGPGGRKVVEELRSCMAQSQVFLALGCHPRFADKFGKPELQRLESLAKGRKGGLVAIGECGLDLCHSNKVTLAVQKKTFAEQVALALRLKLPIVLHIRRAEAEGRQLLQEVGVPPSWPMHRHCFKGKIKISFTAILFKYLIILLKN